MEETLSLIEQRHLKLHHLKEQGQDPFQNKFQPEETCQQAKSAYEEGRRVRLAGRITAQRVMGKSQFLDIRDGSGKIQVYGQKQHLGEDAFQLLKSMDMADFIGVEGEMFTTKMGEISVKIDQFVPLCKALRPPPEKWHGLEDTEIRYRQRYLDLMANLEVKDVFLKRSQIIREIRNYLHDQAYIEVETPMMQSIPGGAAAQPFTTHHNALNCQFYMRIALELYLKRLLVGGMDRVFEIGKNFRNEGISRRHNPEFTMLEAYQAYGDYQSMMDLVQGMITHVAEKVLGTLVIEHKNRDGEITRTIDLTPPWKTVPYKTLICEKSGDNWFELSPEQRRLKATELGAEIQEGDEDFEVTNAIFEKFIEPTLIQPTFVTHLPKELVPLAKLSPEDASTVEVFECCINGQEIAPAYTEQNDPVQQRERLEQQAGGEQQKLDEDFLVALEHGMPPAGGMGMGIDRLCMMLLGQESIRDVLLFPQMKPKQKQGQTLEENSQESSEESGESSSGNDTLAS